MVSINDCLPSQNEILYGVPRGSTLGSLLFLLYVNDLFASIDHQAIMHAHDMTRFIPGANKIEVTRTANKVLDSVSSWLTSHKQYS